MYKKYLLIIPFTLFLMILPISFVSLEDRIYFWDLSGYWNFWIDFHSMFNNDLYDSIKALLGSIRSNDYNLLPIVIPSIFNYFPIESRLSYILSIVIIYFIPLLLLINRLFYVIGLAKTWKDFILISVISSSFIAFWAPVLRGYPDICGLIFILLALISIIKNDFSNKISIKNAILLGILLWLPFVLRRWYAYSIVSLYLSLPILNFLLHNKLGKIKYIIINFTVSGITSIILSFILQKNILIRILNTDYSSIYSAYQTSMYDSIMFFINDVGLGIILVSFIFYTLLIFNKKNVLLLIFFLFNLIFSFFLFTRTQAPGIQHNLPFSMWVLFIFIIGALNYLNKKHTTCSIFLIAIISLSSIQYSLFGKENLFSSHYSAMQTLPVKVENFNNYVKLVSRLESLIEKNRKVDITVYSSSGSLNGEMLDTISDRRLRGIISPTKDVDLRDLLNVEGLMSKYVVVTDPIQTHLPIETQRIITIPVNSIIKGEDIGKAYRRIHDGEFILSNGVKAYIYEKYRAFTLEEIEEFMDKIYYYYPEWKAIYNNKEFFIYLLAFISKGDVWGEYSYHNGEIFIHPGENAATVIEWTKLPYSNIKVDSFNTSCNITDPVRIEISNEYIKENFLIAKGEKRTIYIGLFKNSKLAISIDKVNISDCDGLKLIFN